MNSKSQSALNSATTLMLDMDGTILDLAFDNYMWNELIPRRYAAENAMLYEDARALLMAKYEAVDGELDWYCLDHWCDRLGFDVVQLHHDVSHRIAYLPGALDFLRHVETHTPRVLLVTNAHRDTLALKDAMTGLGDYFEGLHSSHDYGYAKESQEFWHALQEDVDFDPETTLFIDDSQPVLNSARDYGIKMLLTVTQPDSTEPRRTDSEFNGVRRVSDLL